MGTGSLGVTSRLLAPALKTAAGVSARTSRQEANTRLATSVPNFRALISSHLRLRFVGHLHFRGADVLDLHRRGAIDVGLMIAGRDLALNLYLVLGEGAVLDPELDRAFGVGRFGRL